jgi:hypothetical protein
MTARCAAGWPSGQDYAGAPAAATSAAPTHLEQAHEDHHRREARDHVGPRPVHHLGPVTPMSPLNLTVLGTVRPSVANSASSQTWGRQACAAHARHPRTSWDE